MSGFGFSTLAPSSNIGFSSLGAKASPAAPSAFGTPSASTAMPFSFGNIGSAQPQPQQPSFMGGFSSSTNNIFSSAPQATQATQSTFSFPGLAATPGSIGQPPPQMNAPNPVRDNISEVQRDYAAKIDSLKNRYVSQGDKPNDDCKFKFIHMKKRTSAKTDPNLIIRGALLDQVNWIF